MREQEGDQIKGLTLANLKIVSIILKFMYTIIIIIIISAPPNIFHYHWWVKLPRKAKKSLNELFIFTSFSKTVNDSKVLFGLFFFWCFFVK